MIILDTNLWVFGTLGTDQRAESLLDDIERGRQVSAINAYMLEEALAAFDRVPNLTPRQRGDVKTKFCTRLTRMVGLLEAPSSRDVSDTILTERRRDAHVQLLGRVLDVQPKDVPILVLAFSHTAASDATSPAITPGSRSRAVATSPWSSTLPPT